VRGARRHRLTGLPALLLCILFATPAPASNGSPIAGAFVYPVGDEVDFTKPAKGEVTGFYISDPYLALRGRKKTRRHYGVDLANGRGGSEVRAIASGVVVVSEANAMVKYTRKQKVRVPTTVNGKRVIKTTTRTRTAYKWRTGWGNRVVIRHTLKNGDVVYSLYAHLAPKSVSVKVGDVIAAGQPIARVGRSGRASAAHLHLEVRRAPPEPEPVDPDGEEEERGEKGGPSDEDDGEEIARSGNGTLDPVAFLERYVVRFEDLEPGTWEARYAMAACRDGILGTEEKRFEPEAEIRRDDFYLALVATFQLGTTLTKPTFEGSTDALVDAGILDATAARKQHDDDRLTRSDALELVLRCLDRGAARGRSLARVENAALCRDFNRQFAGADAAAQAERDAKDAALAATKAKEKEARARYERDLRWVKAKKLNRKVRMQKVKPVAPVYTLDAGFEKLAESDRRITRAETALLLASALRLNSKQLSALERAARRAGTTTAEG
jgi:murein DD-endopeptidase MepM/ murein hydrolase activator NlpD